MEGIYLQGSEARGRVRGKLQRCHQCREMGVKRMKTYK